jgi:hypothetical protein
MDYKDFYTECNLFLDKLDTSDISANHRERMRASVLDVLAYAADRERRGEAFE